MQRTFQDSGAPEGAEVHRSGTRPYDNAPMVSMSMSAWGRRAVVAVGVLALTLTAAVLPAGANPRGDCPLGRICLYDGRGFTGTRRALDGAVRPCTTAGGPVWSAVNRSGPRAGTARYRLRLYRDTTCQNQAATVTPEAGRENTGGSRSFVIEEVA